MDNQIYRLKEEFKEEKNKNQNLNNEIKKLNNIIEQLKNNDYILKEKIKQLEKEINNKNIEIQGYISQLQNVNEITLIKPGEKIIVVLFMTQGNQDIFNYAMACKNTDLFVRLEEKLYNDYPKYKNYETYFMVNAKRILRFKTVEENNIKNNDIISLFFNDD